jgi:hypothetical protein
MKLSLRKSDTEPKAPKPPKEPKLRKHQGAGNSAKVKKGGGRFVIIIGDEGAILVYMQGTTVVRRLFAASPQTDHTDSIVELMRSHPKAPIYILADVLDQQYVRHTFPPVSAMSVGGLVKRRLQRDFQAEDLTGSLPLGRDKTGRKEWNFLLIALANTPLMQQWVELLVELPNELKGIYLVPVEGQNYIKALKKQLGGAVVPWQLLVTHHKVSGFRQIVLKEGKLVFTRATQAIDEDVTAVLAGNIEQEILNTLEYLRRLGFEENETIELMVVTSQEVKESIDANRFKAGAAHVMTPLDIADMLGQQQSALSADRFGDVVMATWFGTTKKRTLKLNTAYGSKLATMYTARRAIMGIASLAVLGLVGMAGMNVMNSMNAADEAQSLEAQRLPLQSEIETVKKSLDNTDKSIALKSAIVTTYDVYLKNAQTPLDFISDFAPNIPANMRVISMKWNEVESYSTATAPSPGKDGTVSGPLEINLDTEFTGSYNDVEALTQAVDATLAQLKKSMPRYDIKPEPYPWLSKGETNVEISIGSEQAIGQMAPEEKKLKITFYGPKPETNNQAGAPPMALGDDPMMP